MNDIKVDPRFEGLLDYLKRTRGFDFTGYKRTSLTRRVKRRMEVIGVDDFIDYVDYLEVHPHEFTNLFNTILINVTGFFRDQPAWDYLETDVLPKILSSKGSSEQIRIWSAGCASGEEAYSLAMLISDAIGLDAFQERVKIYATDIDDEALAQARAATYPASSLRNLPEEKRERFFARSGDHFTFRSDLRRSVIFGRHDLVHDAPISKLDLLVCRNALMYLNAETQKKILSRFHFALLDTGYLFLGKAEMLLTHSNLFLPADSRFRVFLKSQRTELRDRLMVMEQSGDSEAVQRFGSQLILKDCAYEVSWSPQIVVDTAGALVMANERGRQMFSLSHKDIGRPLQDLELSYRPVELRSVIEQCEVGNHSMQLSGIERRNSDGSITYLDIYFSPLQGIDATIIGTAITFVDVSASFRLHADLQRSNRELETTNEELQSAQEELETTNEELQSTNEELETTNEELQSTNEELETMNEELQSTNEELETINAEQRQLTAELHHANTFLNSILASMRCAVLVLDNNFKVLVWNSKAEDLWGLRSFEVQNQSLFDLDIGLPMEELRVPLIEFSKHKGEAKELSLAAVNRRGRKISCHIAITRLVSQRKDIEGIVLLMEENGNAQS